MLNKKFIFSVIFVVISIVIALCLAEGTLLLKNSSMRNYDIEMWRYSKELKKESKNPLLGHEHIPSKEAIRLFNLDHDSKTFLAEGCSSCSFSGFQGRIAIAECIQIDQITRDLIHQKASEQKIVEHVFKDQPSIDAASRELVVNGITSSEEIMRLNNLTQDASL